VRTPTNLGKTHKFRIQDIHPYDADGSTSASLVRDVKGIQEEEMDATGLVVALRDHIVDGEVVETQTECIDLEEGEDEIWDELASATGALAGPRWESNPYMDLTTGRPASRRGCGIPTRPRSVAIEAIWVEPVTGTGMEMTAMACASTSSSSRAICSRSCSTSRAASRYR